MPGVKISSKIRSTSSSTAATPVRVGLSGALFRMDCTSPAVFPAETNTVQVAVLPSAARAVMAALPGFFASTRPPEVTAATLGSEDDQLTAAFAVSSAEFPAVSESSLLLSLSPSCSRRRGPQAGRRPICRSRSRR